MTTEQFIPAFVQGYSNSAFTNPHEVVLPDDPKECTGNFTHMGAQYWGLETDRHKATTVDTNARALNYRHDAHHWVTIRFEQRAVVSKLMVSTKWFTGNQVRAITAILRDDLTGQEQTILTRAPLDPDAEHTFEIDEVTATECHFELYYEGGISRINFFGEMANEQLPARANLFESATLSHVSNEHYGNPTMAVKGTRAEMHMVGWESARTGFGEQALFTLNKPTVVEELIVDTYLHRLNPPLTCHVFGLTSEHTTDADINTLMAQRPRWKLRFGNGKEVIPKDFQDYMLAQQYLTEDIANPTQFQIMLHVEHESPWSPVLPFAALRADTWHRFTTFENSGPFTHVLYMHYPNGGVHGLKLFGTEQ